MDILNEKKKISCFQQISSYWDNTKKLNTRLWYFLEFTISVRGEHCDYSLPTPKHVATQLYVIQKRLPDRIWVPIGKLLVDLSPVVNRLERETHCLSSGNQAKIRGSVPPFSQWVSRRASWKHTQTVVYISNKNSGYESYYLFQNPVSSNALPIKI
jgi:hypothetical protein